MERPSDWRSSGSPWNTPKNRAPSPASSAASSSVITDIDASIVQYGAGHASVPGAEPGGGLVGLGVAVDVRLRIGERQQDHRRVEQRLATGSVRRRDRRQRDVPETRGLIALEHDEVPALRLRRRSARERRVDEIVEQADWQRLVTERPGHPPPAHDVGELGHARHPVGREMRHAQRSAGVTSRAISAGRA